MNPFLAKLAIADAEKIVLERKVAELTSMVNALSQNNHNLSKWNVFLQAENNRQKMENIRLREMSKKSPSKQSKYGANSDNWRKPSA